MEDFSSLVITKLSAKDLENVSLFGRMKVYAVVSITGGPSSGHESEFVTPVDDEGETNPRWKTRIELRIHNPSLLNNRLHLNINLHCGRTFGDREVGRVRVPVKGLFDRVSGNRTSTVPLAVWYPVESRPNRGKQAGVVKFCFAFGEIDGGRQTRRGGNSTQYDFESNWQQEGQDSRNGSLLSSATGSREVLYKQGHDQVMDDTQVYADFDGDQDYGDDCWNDDNDEQDNKDGDDYDGNFDNKDGDDYDGNFDNKDEEYCRDDDQDGGGAEEDNGEGYGEGGDEYEEDFGGGDEADNREGCGDGGDFYEEGHDGGDADNGEGCGDGGDFYEEGYDGGDAEEDGALGGDDDGDNGDLGIS